MKISPESSPYSISGECSRRDTSSDNNVTQVYFSGLSRLHSFANLQLQSTPDTQIFQSFQRACNEWRILNLKSTIDTPTYDNVEHNCAVSSIQLHFQAGS